MAEFQVSPLLPKRLEDELAGILAAESFVNYPPELSLATTNCGIVSHVMAQCVKRLYDIEIDPYVANRIEGMTFPDSNRPANHVFMYDPEKEVIVDPTALQVVGSVGLVPRDVGKFSASPNEIIGVDRIFEIRNSPEGIYDFVEFISGAVRRVRDRAMPIREQLSAPYDGSQAFLDPDMPQDELTARLTDVWTISNYERDPLAERKQFFQEHVFSITERLMALDNNAS